MAIEWEGQNIKYTKFLLSNRSSTPSMSFGLVLQACKGCNFLLVSFHVTIESASRVKMKVVDGSRTAVKEEEQHC